MTQKLMSLKDITDFDMKLQEQIQRIQEMMNLVTEDKKIIS